MSYKHYVLDESEDWDTYWSQTSIKQELDKIKTDGLMPIFKKYLKKNSVNLEAGCGLGKWVIGLKKAGYNIIGLDNYVKGLGHIKSHSSTLSLVAGDVASLGLKTNSIDAYISLGVVEHFEAGPQVALEEAYRVLKPGGLALIEVPYDSPLRQLTRAYQKLIHSLKTPARFLVETLKLRSPRPKHPQKFYEYRYTRNELETFVQNAGFKLSKTLPKDDLAPDRSISLWSDFPSLRHPDGTLFKLNQKGSRLKSLLNSFSLFSSPALIVTLAYKPKHA